MRCAWSNQGISEPSQARAVAGLLLKEVRATGDELTLVLGDESFEVRYTRFLSFVCAYVCLLLLRAVGCACFQCKKFG